MKKYQLIAIDIDGTLLNDKKEILEETKNDIIEAHQKGKVIAISTGRAYYPAMKYFSQFDFNIPLILFNGGRVRMSHADSDIYSKTFDNDLANKIFNIINDNDGTCCFWSGDAVYFNKDNNYCQYYATLTSIKPIIINEDFILKDINKFIWFDKPDNLKMIQNNILSIVDGINYFKSQLEMLEIVPCGVSKGDALKFLADYLKIDVSQVIAIGDDENDISMIKYADLGVAMGNAKEIVKECSNYICDTNNHNGVGKVIRKFML